ncbi:S8 family serine peptidase [Lederbergia citrea]|uniref:S8 family serine peptidase n=1 Tax=Lederbergia citrea TaxID=2833581 RepID=UPI001BCA150F|nr:S8 family serine peptidase [Lederbergia citrea]MBS4204813.1 S8 family serine peptidase [Lederbergia citrea]
MQKNIKKLFIFVFILCLLLLEMQINVQASINDNSKEEASKPLKLQDNLEQKLAKSKSRTVRVIVQIDEQFTPEGLISKSQKNSQKNKIKKAQETIIEGLHKKGSNAAKNISNFKTIPYMALEVDSEGLKALKENKKVKNIIEDKIISKSNINEEANKDVNELSPQLYQTNSVMDTEKAWSSGFTGQGKTVAILDTGVDKSHPFLQNKVVYEACFSSRWLCSGYSESTGSGAAVDTDGHGTHVAGIATGNGSLFSGVAKNAKIIAIKVLADSGSGTFSDLLNGLEQVYLLRDQYDISAINLSLGGGSFFSACDYSYSSIKSIVDNLKSAGIATIAASGNDSYKSSISAPACISSVISVGATNNSDNVAYFSNSASFLDLLAPGYPVYSSLPGGRYGSMSGTSMATPQVAGGFTLVKQKYPSSTVDQIVSYMKQNGVNVRDSANNITTPRLNFSWMRPNLPTLGQVQKPTWNGDTIQWTGVPNASQYELNLYKGSTTVHTQRVSSSVRQVNLASKMTSHGIYFVTVQAIGNNTNYQDGQLSPPSNENRKGIVYFENFERNNGSFTVSGVNSSWQWGTPTSGPGSAYSGTKVWATNLSGNYNNNEKSYITSPSINLSDVLSPIILSWMQFVETETYWDFITVEVSKDGGRTWDSVYRNHGAINQDWENQKIDIDSSYAVPNFKVRFGLDADYSYTYSGFYIDDVMVTGIKTIPFLTQVQKPIWNGNVIQWNGVANASQYELKLYRGTTLIKTQRVANSVRQYDFTSLMTNPGAYTVTVQAIGDSTNYRDGAVSSPSDVNQKIITLAKVQKPNWNGNMIQWNDVANVSQYELKLYRGTTLIKTQRVANSVRQYDFASLMTNPGAYTVTIQAIGDTTNYRDGAVSSPSDVNQKIITLAKVQKPNWNGNMIQWNEVANASQYELKLHRGTTLIKTQRVTNSVRQYDFTSLMTNPGAYTVSVQAIGDSTNYRDGAVSSPSDVNQKIITLAKVQKPNWNGNMIQWNEVANASLFELKLFRGTTLIKTQRVANSDRQYDFTSLMTNPGAYTVTIQAIGDSANYRDGAISSPSDVNRKIISLAKVQKPTWNGNMIQWNEVANASQFELKLFRGTTLIKTQRVANSVRQYDFTSLMTNPGAYTVTIQAIGDTTNYRDGAISSPSDVNRKIISLAKVQKPTWNGDIIKWSAVANTSKYELKLYRGNSLVHTQRVAANVLKYNFAAKMKTPGAYTVTVQSIGDNITYRNGAVSIRSNQKVTLNRVSKPTWNGDVIKWSAVANTSKYELKLYRGNSLVHTQRVAANVRQYNFASKMKTPGAYTVTVQAIGDNITYRNGAISIRSNQKVTLNRVPKPTWDGDVIKWSAVANTSKYELKLYRGNSLFHTQRVAANVRKYNFASRMKTPGAYTVTVQAIGDTKTNRNGPISERSGQKRK